MPARFPERGSAPQREGAALLRSERLAAIGDLDALGAWFRGGLDELHAAGILDFISTQGELRR
jgi:hypothetical protein